jgi:hypothetical protein
VTLLFLLSLCSFSSYSDTYEQRYQEGDTGPNGGVVTGVVVDSQLTDTTVEMVGDFEETTYTYQYTETITELVDETTQVTETVVTSVTSPDLIPTDGDFDDTNINVIGPQGNTYGMTGAEFTTGNQAMGGGTRVYEGELPVDNMQSIDYGATVYSHSSNASVPACGNTTSDCRDDFSIVVRLYNDGELVETQSHIYEGIDWSGSREYDYSIDVSEMNIDYGSMTLYGIDRGFNSGYYGPGFSDVYVHVTYNVITNVINTIVSRIEQETILNTDVYVYESVYIPPIVDIQIEPITATDFEVEVVHVDEFGTETVEVFEVELEVPELAPAEMEMEIVEEMEYASLEVDDTEPDNREVSAEVQEEEVDAAEEAVQESSEDVEQSVEVAEESTDEQQASKSEVRENTRKPTASGYSVALDSVKVALMVQNEASRAFTAYQQETIQDVPFYSPVAIDGGQTVDNPLGRWMTGASDILMDEMVDSQWQR